MIWWIIRRMECGVNDIMDCVGVYIDFLIVDWLYIYE